MKINRNLRGILSIGIVTVFLIPTQGWSQDKRIKKPKRESKIKSVDNFVKHSFELYHKVFVYDSLVKVGVEVPAEIEDELLERAERNIDSLWQVVPDIAEDISDAPFLKQAKATLNLNRTKKALNFCMNAVKFYIKGTEEDDEDQNKE